MSTACTKIKARGAFDPVRIRTDTSGRYPGRVTPVDRRDADPGSAPDARAAVRGTLALAAFQVVGRALGLAFVLVATRVLNPAEFGRYAIASALLLGASAVADLGTTSVITKLVSREPGRCERVVASAVPPSAALGALSLAGLVAFVLGAGYDSVTRADVLLAGVGLPADAVTTSLFGGFDGRGLIARRAVLSLVRVAVIAGGGLVGVVVIGGVRPAIVALAAAPWVTLLFTIAAARRSGIWRGRLLFDRIIIRSLVRQAIPFAVLGGINIIVLRADVVILSVMTNAAEVARYDVAVRTTEALTFLATVVAAPSLYILSSRIGQGDIPGAQRAYDEAVRAAYLLGLPLSAMLVALGDPLAEILFGSKYRTSGQLLVILGLQVWLAFVASIQGSLLLAAAQLRRAVKLFGGLAVLAVALATAAIAVAGATGAAVAMVIVQLVIVASAARFSRKVAGVALPLPGTGAPVSAVVSGGVMYALGQVTVIGALFAGALAYAMLLFATHAVARSDLALLTYLGAARKD